ncbi:OPT oligopeptide transporter [Hysterangium stoloniferum]|nr:OPT oligopeptide transporter [Hysterangium stoloniferum]
MDSATILRRRRALPDVPEDITLEDHLVHLNDPNYTFDSQEWSETDSFELDDKNSAVESHFSSGKTETYYDVESATQSDYSRSSSRIATSRAPVLVDEEYDESPYPEVRAAVPTMDDPNMPINTFRTWFLGLLLSAIISGVNQFFNARTPGIFVTALIIQLIALPMGKGMEYILPTWKFTLRIPFTSQKYVCSFNPGPFNIKEHVLITVMANVTAGGSYATDVIMVQRLDYNYHNVAYELFLTISTQILGFSIAGFTRRYLVWPAAMIWPGALVNCALFTTLHKNYGRKERKHISRERFFLIAFLLSIVYYWIPGYLFTALSVFNWVCWIAPQNPVVNTLFGTSSGLGMGILTFDWSMITWIGSPLVTPWWTQANILVSLVLFFWIIAPILYFKNVFYSKFLPMAAPVVFDNTGFPYDISRIVVDGVFSPELYQQYSPLYLPLAFAISYGLQFATFTATLVHVFLWYRKDIIQRFKRSLREERDVHCRLMSVYEEVPAWWYTTLGVVAFTIGLIVIETFQTKLPVWAYVFAITMSTLYVIPAGVIQAVTNQTIGLNVISEVIGGSLLPGKPVAVMLFKTYGNVTMAQAMAFTADLKLGHYMKIPPRTMFMAQVIATILSCFVVTGVQDWQFANIVDFCSPDNTQGFTCPPVSIFSTAAIVWGGVGAGRMFGQGALWFFFIGAVLPIPFYYAAKRWPTSIFKYINIPIFFFGPAIIPPASGVNIASWALVGFIFQSWIRRTHFRWWMRFNYILSAALDAGVAVGVLLVFFSLQLPKGGITLNWWGNTVWRETADAQGLPFIILDANQTFGPSVGQFF